MLIKTQYGVVDPTFSGQPEALAAALTQWLWANPKSNPRAANPDSWDETGFAVTFLDRSITFSAVPAGETASQKLNLGGGKNVIVFSRVQTVTPTTIATDPNTIVLPNQLPNFTLVQQKRTDGLEDIQEVPLQSCFGWGLAPYVLPVPERWLGNLEQRFVVTNNNTYPVDITLSWHLAILNTGR